MASRYHSAMRLDPVSLRLFVAAMEEGAIARAAEREHLAASAASRRLADLVQQLGVALFERTSRRVALSPAGQALVPDVRDLLTRAQALPMRAREAAGGEVGRIRLAFVSTVGFEQLPAWVRAFRAAYELGRKTVAVYAYEDRNAEHRIKADESYQIGEVGHPVRAYLDIDSIVATAKACGADAIYPVTAS